MHQIVTDPLWLQVKILCHKGSTHHTAHLRIIEKSVAYSSQGVDLTSIHGISNCVPSMLVMLPLLSLDDVSPDWNGHLGSTLILVVM